MTSVIAYVYKNHSLAFVGTKSGKLKKVGQGVVILVVVRTACPQWDGCWLAFSCYPGPGWLVIQVCAKEVCCCFEADSGTLVPSLPSHGELLWDSHWVSVWIHLLGLVCS